MTTKTKPPRDRATIGKASRAKGAAGERDAIAALAAVGVVAIRSASMQSGRQRAAKVPDLFCEAPWSHLWCEVKRTETVATVWAGLRQAEEGIALLPEADRAARVPVVLYRGNGTSRAPTRWVAVFKAADHYNLDGVDFRHVCATRELPAAIRLVGAAGYSDGGPVYVPGAGRRSAVFVVTLDRLVAMVRTGEVKP